MITSGTKRGRLYDCGHILRYILRYTLILLFPSDVLPLFHLCSLPFPRPVPRRLLSPSLPPAPHPLRQILLYRRCRRSAPRSLLCLLPQFGVCECGDGFNRVEEIEVAFLLLLPQVAAARAIGCRRDYFGGRSAGFSLMGAEERFTSRRQ